VTAALARVAELVEGESGIEVKESQMEALETALRRVSPEMNAARLLAAVEDPTQRGLLLGRLIDQLAVQETFFLRERDELEAIDWHGLLAAARARGAAEVNVWVAACASGEEAYSLALLATEAFGHGSAPVSILATDISARALRRAEEGVYSERSVRELSPERRERFLVPERNQSVVGDQLRSLVRLRRHNLVADPAPPSGEVRFDVVLCRNVLIYFAADTVERVVGSLESALQPGGQLILGAADRLTSSARRLTELARRELEPSAPIGPRRRRREPAGRAPKRSPASARPTPSGSIEDALRAADRGEYEAAIESARRVLADDPLSADANYVRGVSELAMDDPGAAVRSLRRALYIDPSFVLAAFQLARGHELRGDMQAARRSYAQTLRVLAREEERSRTLLEGGDAGDIAAACRARLGALGGAPTHAGREHRVDRSGRAGSP
jgi:chemotaxis protein methyltransferase CheR